tara:strand:- start:410 stop:1444 length:1035 start_codon:yes stop_codon:yes gene_type:complete
MISQIKKTIKRIQKPVIDQIIDAYNGHAKKLKKNISLHIHRAYDLHIQDELDNLNQLKRLKESEQQVIDSVTTMIELCDGDTSLPQQFADEAKSEGLEPLLELVEANPTQESIQLYVADRLKNVSHSLFTAEIEINRKKSRKTQISEPIHRICSTILEYCEELIPNNPIPEFTAETYSIKGELHLEKAYLNKKTKRASETFQSATLAVKSFQDAVVEGKNDYDTISGLVDAYHLAAENPALNQEGKEKIYTRTRTLLFPFILGKLDPASTFFASIKLADACFKIGEQEEALLTMETAVKCIENNRESEFLLQTGYELCASYAIGIRPNQIINSYIELAEKCGGK